MNDDRNEQDDPALAVIEARSFKPSSAKTFAAELYSAYGDDAAWKNFQGNEMPQWGALPPAIRAHWVAVAIRASMLENNTPIRHNAFLLTEQAAGWDAPPPHYAQQERETIDRIRDELGDPGFIAFCRGNIIKYRDRKDAKGDPQGDEEKALWYEMMALHVEGDAHDPRALRPGFTGYQREGKF